ncbi:MAG: ribosome-binding factor A, partial [Desulfuromonadales bacterium]|nr:ribosome-binding factor A [Desulfuromonadales bacterium]
MASQRAQRVAETIHKEISNLLIKGLKDPRIGFVTITSVDVTSDLRLAKVY